MTPDETGWRVEGQPAWLHAWVAERATCYAIDPQRKADVLERLIGIDWSGTMIHDGFSSYDRFAAATHQQCLGHVLRRVRELEAKATRGAVHYPRKLIALFTEAIHLRNRYLKGEVSAEQLRQARPEFDRRLRGPGLAGSGGAGLRDAVGAPVEPPGRVVHVPEPSRDRADELGGGASDPPGGGEPQGVGREPHLGGAHAQEVLMSVLETCQRAGRSGLEFVSQTLRAFGNPLLPRPILLTPR